MVELQPPELGPIFHALSDSTRRRMLLELASASGRSASWRNPSPSRSRRPRSTSRAWKNAGLIQREVRGRTHSAGSIRGRCQRPRVADVYERFSGSARLDVLERLPREEDDANKSANSKPTPKRRRQGVNERTKTTT